MNFSKPTELSGDWENVRTREKSLDRMDFPSSTFLLCSANWDRIGPYNKKEKKEKEKEKEIVSDQVLNEWVCACFHFPFWCLLLWWWLRSILYKNIKSNNNKSKKHSKFNILLIFSINKQIKHFFLILIIIN